MNHFIYGSKKVLTLGSINAGYGIPVMIIALPLESAKFNPSLTYMLIEKFVPIHDGYETLYFTFPRHTARKTAPFLSFLSIDV
jgi:hypothetical protein